MFLIPSGQECSGKRRAAVVVSVIAAALGGLVSSLLKHGWNDEEPGVDPTWRFVSLGVSALVIVAGVTVLLVQWRRRQDPTELSLEVAMPLWWMLAGGFLLIGWSVWRIVARDKPRS